MYICALIRSLDKSPPIFSLSSQQLEDCRLLSRALTENADLLQSIQTLSFSLISTYTSDIQRDNSLCPLSRFIVFWHLREDGTFQPPSSISPNLASVTYCFRAVAVLQAHAHMLADPSIIFMEYVLLFTLGVLLTSFKILHDPPSPFIERRIPYPFQRLATAYTPRQRVRLQLC